MAILLMLVMWPMGLLIKGKKLQRLTLIKGESHINAILLVNNPLNNCRFTIIFILCMYDT